jgi:hypothetical protein
MTESEIREHIEWLMTIIVNLRSAIASLSTGTSKSYSINTGQTTQSVTKKDLGNLMAQLQLHIMDLQFYREMLADDFGGEIVRAL